MVNKIFSDEMHEKYANFTVRVKGDTSGIAKLTLFVLGMFTILLLFWWRLVGAPIEYLYVVNWWQRYPDVPIQESVTWNVLQFMEVFTMIFLAVVWLYIILYAITLIYKKKPEKTLVVTPQGAKRVCPNCTGTHVRNAGGKNKGKNYCMSCRRYF